MSGDGMFFDIDINNYYMHLNGDDLIFEPFPWGWLSWISSWL